MSDLDLAARARAALGGLEGAAFLERVSVCRVDLEEALASVYPEAADLVSSLVDDALRAAADRPEAMRELDRRREVDPHWFQRPSMVGYVAYADRYAGTLRGVVDRLDHLEGLGVHYLHLMPLLATRQGENDGGYAVVDYDAVDPRLGTMDDLEQLATVLHRREMTLCVDLVVNHTAQEHPWARAAAEGDRHHRAFYRFFPDRAQPDAYEQTLPEVFPDLAPGNFTHLEETDEWVWSTFHEFQWDLDWSNPDVLRAMLGVLLRLGNRGVDVVRLDAVPFLWKRLGTDCQNQPEAHRILQALRALTRLAMPGLLLKAEAIVGPDLLTPYLGDHARFRPECDLAYDNQLMVMLWSSLATRDTRLAVQALSRRRPAPPTTSWVTYTRCHDDIGWAVDDHDAAAVGLDPRAHRAFLAAFYAGRHPGSFADGLDFQANPATGDARTSGSLAALCGVDAARRRGTGLDAALARLVLLHAITYSFGGMPLLYMGDELALANDDGWAVHPDHADDNRWLHRPTMDWEVASRITEEGTVEARAYAALAALAAARRGHEALRADATTEVLATGRPGVLAFVRRHPRAAPLLVLGAFSDDEQVVDSEVLQRAGVGSARLLHASPGARWRDGSLRLEPWGFAWVSGD